MPNIEFLQNVRNPQIGNRSVLSGFENAAKKYMSSVNPGGHWKPDHCRARQRTAVIIPFRNREAHLEIFLKYMHPFLQKQQIEYRIVVVEQVSSSMHMMEAQMLEFI